MNATHRVVTETLTSKLKNFVVRIEDVPDEPRIIGVGVYGVDQEQVMIVAETVLDAEEQLFPDGEFALLPLVRNQEVTARYYPQFLEPWHWQFTSGYGEESDLPSAAAVPFIYSPNNEEYSIQQPSGAMPLNQAELAWAA